MKQITIIDLTQSTRYIMSTLKKFLLQHYPDSFFPDRPCTTMQWPLIHQLTTITYNLLSYLQAASNIY